MNIIQYEEALSEYNQALLNTLRGFTPKYEFISSWVPDADLTLSVISLVESAFSDEVFEFSIIFDNKTLSVVEINNFNDCLTKIAKFDVVLTNEETQYQFKGLQDTNNRISFQENQRLLNKNTTKQEVHEENIIKNDDGIYQDKISYYRQNTMSDPTENMDEAVQIASVNIEEYSLIVGFDENQIIQSIRYEGDFDDMQLGIFEAARQLFVGLPLTEIRDNGLALVEYKLRAHDRSRRVIGVQIHFNYSPIFSLLERFIKALSKEYASRKINTFDIRNNLRLSEENKTDLNKKMVVEIQSYLDAHKINCSFDIESVDDIARVTLMIGGDLSAVERAELIMRLEVILRYKVHPAIQLYSKLFVDRNTKRQGHQWAVNL